MSSRAGVLVSSPVGVAPSPRRPAESVHSAPRWRVRRGPGAQLAGGAALAALWALLWSLFLSDVGRFPHRSAAPEDPSAVAQAAQGRAP
jgi:hypothetical protein